MGSKLYLYLLLAVSILSLPSCLISTIPIYKEDPGQDSAVVPEKKIRVRSQKKRPKMPKTLPDYTNRRIRNWGPKTVMTEFEINKKKDTKEFELRRDDEIEFLVWQHPELTQVVKIRKNGKGTFPLVGEIDAAGLTLNNLKLSILEKLEEKRATTSMTLTYNDIVRFSVWQHADLNHEAVVQPDGVITLPLVGEIQVLGKTLKDIRLIATDRLKSFIGDPIVVSVLPTKVHQRTLMNPEITLLPKKLTAREVVVIGEVLFPGIHPIQEDTRAIDMLAKSHYLNAADLNNVLVVRNGHKDNPQYRRLKLWDYLKGMAPDQNIQLYPEDIILLPKLPIVQVGDFIQRFFARTQAIFNWKIAMDVARFGEGTPNSLNSVRSRVEAQQEKRLDNRVSRIFEAAVNQRINESIGDNIDDVLDDRLGGSFDAAIDNALDNAFDDSFGDPFDSSFNSNDLNFLLEQQLEQQLTDLFQ